MKNMGISKKTFDYKEEQSDNKVTKYKITFQTLMKQTSYVNEQLFEKSVSCEKAIWEVN